VYRRSSMSRITVQEPGFLGVPEMIGKLDLMGYQVREIPATLEVRLLGRSKMKLRPVIFGHLALMGRLLRLRLSTAAVRNSDKLILRKEPGIERVTTR
jgi:hypothetical protein